MRRWRLAPVARRLHRLDRALLSRSARSRAPHTDRALTLLTGAADHGKLWYGIAAGMALTGRRRPRVAAVSGLAGQAIASTLVNGPLKFAWRRDRPSRELLGVAGTLLPRPRTYSFPSGHSASAFGFATGVSAALPAAAPLLLPLAGAVAYSRVHTGVHYPSDVLAGATVGVTAGLSGAALVRRARQRAIHRPHGPALDVPVPRAAVLVTSRHAGRAEHLPAVREALRADGVCVAAELDVRDADRLPDVIRGTDGHPPLVIAAGGDGTVGRAAGVVLETDALLAIVPLGTSNDVARSLGVPPDPREAARTLASGVVCAIDAGQVRTSAGETRTFVHAASAGLNTEFAKLATATTMRERLGALAYPVSAALALRRYRPFDCTITREDGTSDTFPIVHVSVSNATVFGGPLGMRVPGGDLTDGLLDVIVVERLSVPRVALAAADTTVGRHTPVRRVHTYQTRSVRVDAARGRELAVDGEVVGTLPAEFTVLPRALRVVVPAVL